MALLVTQGMARKSVHHKDQLDAKQWAAAEEEIQKKRAKDKARPLDRQCPHCEKMHTSQNINKCIKRCEKKKRKLEIEIKSEESIEGEFAYKRQKTE